MSSDEKDPDPDKDDETGLLTRVAEKVSETVSAMVTNAMYLEVKTYVTDDMDAAAEADGAPESTAGTRLWAYTKSGLDGDTELLIALPGDAGQNDQADQTNLIDETVWRIHKETVEQAQKHRKEMLQLALDLVKGIIK